jgi:PBP1b-binding outer membrane lipoprotein LpoB
MNMKKISAIIVVLVLAVAFAGCTKQEAQTPAVESAVTSTATTTAAPAAH